MMMITTLLVMMIQTTRMTTKMTMMLIMTPMITGYVDNDDAKLHPQQEQLLYI
jgi:hypothetical protein